MPLAPQGCLSLVQSARPWGSLGAGVRSLATKCGKMQPWASWAFSGTTKGQGINDLNADV